MQPQIKVCWFWVFMCRYEHAHLKYLLDKTGVCQLFLKMSHSFFYLSICQFNEATK